MLRMEMSLKQTQRLVMTPMLSQAIKLLQLQRLDLQQFVKQEMLDNPMLEEVQAENQTTEVDEMGRERVEDKEEGDLPSERADSEVDWESYFDDGADMGSPPMDRDFPTFENNVTSLPSLHDHLLWQLRLSTDSEPDYKIGEEIIGNIDEFGYLKSTVEEMIEELGASKEDVEDILDLIQNFEPAGVGARNLEECLILQIEETGKRKDYLECIIEHHLENLESKNFKAIAGALKISIEEVYELVDVISSLDPKPGRVFNPDEVNYVIPDVYVYKVDDEYVIIVNDDGIPRLRISNFYKKILKEEKEGKEKSEKEKKYVEDKLRSALWLVRSIQQRQITIYKVAESLVNFQKDFFEKGISYLKPLTLKDVAESIDMHESTVSRVTTNKYIHTPRGIFELKYFFHSGLAGKGGDSISSVRIKEMIKELIREEDSSKPYTDNDILEELRNQGVKIARRTVAKYREALNILPSSKRKIVMQ